MVALRLNILTFLRANDFGNLVLELTFLRLILVTDEVHVLYRYFEHISFDFHLRWTLTPL